MTPRSAFRAGSGAHRAALALPAGVRKRIRLRDALTYSVVGLALSQRSSLIGVSQVSDAIRCRDDIRVVQFWRLAAGMPGESRCRLPP